MKLINLQLIIETTNARKDQPIVPLAPRGLN